MSMLKVVLAVVCVVTACGIGSAAAQENNGPFGAYGYDREHRHCFRRGGSQVGVAMRQASAAEARERTLRGCEYFASDRGTCTVTEVPDGQCVALVSGLITVAGGRSVCVVAESIQPTAADALREALARCRSTTSGCRVTMERCNKVCQGPCP